MSKFERTTTKEDYWEIFKSMLKFERIAPKENYYTIFISMSKFGRTTMEGRLLVIIEDK